MIKQKMIRRQQEVGRKSRRKAYENYTNLVRSKFNKYEFPNEEENEFLRTGILTAMRVLNDMPKSISKYTWQELVDYSRRVENIKTMKALGRDFKQGIELPDELRCRISDELQRKLTSNTRAKSIFNTDMWKVAYTLATVFSFGFYWGDIIFADCKVMSSIFKTVSALVDVKDFERIFTYTYISGATETAAAQLVALSNKNKKDDMIPNVDTLLFGLTPVLCANEVYSKAMYTYLLMLIEKGMYKEIVELILKYVMYLPACINKTAQLLFRVRYQNRRKTAYDNYGLPDTAMLTITQGILEIADLLDAEFGLKSFISKKALTFCKRYISEFENSNNDSEAVSAYREYSKLGNKAYIFERVRPKWISVPDSANKNASCVPIISDALLDIWISSNLNAKSLFAMWKEDNSVLFDDNIVTFFAPCSDEFLSLTCKGFVMDENNYFAAWRLWCSPKYLHSTHKMLADKDSCIKNINAEVERYKGKLSKMQNERDEYKEKYLTEKNKVAEIVAERTEHLTNELEDRSNQIKLLEGQLSILSDKLMNKSHEFSKLWKEYKRSRATAISVEEPETNQGTPHSISIEEKAGTLCKYRYVFIGGQTSMLRQLSNLGFESITNIEQFSDRRSGLKFDHMVICTSRISHKLRFWAQTQTSASAGKTLYFSGSNAELLIDMLYDEIV